MKIYLLPTNDRINLNEIVMISKITTETYASLICNSKRYTYTISLKNGQRFYRYSDHYRVTYFKDKIKDIEHHKLVKKTFFEEYNNLIKKWEDK